MITLDLSGCRHLGRFKHINRANINDDRGMHESAILDYTRALSIELRSEGIDAVRDVPAGRYHGHIAQLYNRGLAMQRSGDKPGAFQDYSNSIRINPANSPYLNRGVIKKDFGTLQVPLRTSPLLLISTIV